MNKNQFLQLKYIFLLLLPFSYSLALSQAVWLVPESPSVTDTVTLYFNSNQGNKELQGYSGDIYFHTGVITDKSLDARDWKYVVGNWGLDDSRVKMTALNDSIYNATFVIQDFYQLVQQENAQQLAFVYYLPCLNSS